MLKKTCQKRSAAAPTQEICANRSRASAARLSAHKIKNGHQTFLLIALKLEQKERHTGRDLETERDQLYVELERHQHEDGGRDQVHDERGTQIGLFHD